MIIYLGKNSGENVNLIAAYVSTFMELTAELQNLAATLKGTKSPTNQFYLIYPVGKFQITIAWNTSYADTNQILPFIRANKIRQARTLVYAYLSLRLLNLYKLVNGTGVTYMQIPSTNWGSRCAYSVQNFVLFFFFSYLYLSDIVSF